MNPTIQKYLDSDLCLLYIIALLPHGYSMAIYGIEDAPDHAHAAITALSYWAFVCRDKKRSPAMGLKTWEFLKNSISNAGMGTTTVTGYLQSLCDRLIVPDLKPDRLRQIIQPQQVVLRAERHQDGSMGDLQQRDGDQGLIWYGWGDLITNCRANGFEEYDLVQTAQRQHQIITVLCRLKFEQDKALGVPTEAESVIDVEAINV